MIYERRASPLHAARATAGAAWAMALIVAAIMFEHPVVLGALLVVTCGGAAFAHVGARVLSMLRFALPFGLLIALVNALVVRDGLTVLWRFGELPVLGRLDVTLEAVAYGLLLGLRAVLILLAAALMSATVDPDGLLRGLRRVSFRSALTAALAVRLVPVLQRDGRRLAEARRCRVDEPGRVAVLRAVASGALDRAADVAATLEVRGYRHAVPRTAVPEPWSRHDLAFAGSALLLVAVATVAWLAGVADVRPYPSTEVELGVAEAAFAAALIVVGLVPFADRRGIER